MNILYQLHLLESPDYKILEDDNSIDHYINLEVEDLDPSENFNI